MTLVVKMLRGRRLLALAAVGASVLLAVMMLWWNARLSGIIDIISAGSALSKDKIASAVAIMIVMCAANALKTYVSGLTCEFLTHDLRMGYARFLSKRSMPEIERLNAGEQLSGLQNEIADVSAYLGGGFFQLLDNGISFFATFGWLLIINAKLTLAVNMPVLVIMIYVFYSSRIIGNATERGQQAKSRMNKHADTLLTLFPIIRLYDASHMMLANYNKAVGEWEQQAVRAEQVRARLMSLSGLLSNIPLMLLFLIGGGMAINGGLSLGTLYIFLNLSGNVSGVMMNMPGFVAAYRQFSANAKRLAPKILMAGEGLSA